MKVLTSFTKLVTGEGIRIAYTYSEVDDSGDLISQNNRGNFVAVGKHFLQGIAVFLFEIVQRIQARNRCVQFRRGEYCFIPQAAQVVS